MNLDFDIAAYNYELPPENIAQEPVDNRGDSRLLALDCHAQTQRDHHFTDILGFLSPGDLLVVNDTKVFPARLEGRKETGGKVELFLLGYPKAEDFTKPDQEGWSRITVTSLLKSSKRPKPGTRLILDKRLYGVVRELLADGKVAVDLYARGNLDTILNSCGRMPLPPYIKRNEADRPEDRERYQTLYASRPGAVAAPTAGLHFSKPLLKQIADKGVTLTAITLHVGYGTFAPVRVTDIRDHEIHEEYVEISKETARLVNQTKEAGKKIWVVGTTTARTLEFGADEQGRLHAREGWCGLYIYPGYRFRLVKNLITNFHLPGSSLLFLVSALAGRHTIMTAYQEAIHRGYRFYSYGDAMAIITEGSHHKK